jgi:hypothetical protein
MDDRIPGKRTRRWAWTTPDGFTDLIHLKSKGGDYANGSATICGTTRIARRTSPNPG